MAQPVFKTGGARQTALEGSTPSPLRDLEMSGDENDALRRLPSVDRLAVSVARATLAERRAELLAGAEDDVDLLARASERLHPSLRRVLNATGVVVHTNLGRAPLARAARAAVARAARWWLWAEKASRSSREMPHWSAIISAPMPWPTRPPLGA